MSVKIQKSNGLIKVASNTVTAANLSNYATKEDLANADSNKYCSASEYASEADKNTNGTVYFVN